MKNPIRRASRAWMLALTLGPALAAPSPAAHAADYVTAMAGGGGGTQYHLPCKADEVLVGLKGRASALVDRVQALCAQVDPLGRWVGNPQARGAAGGTGGSVFTLSCPRDHAISGFQGRAATFIDQLRIRCGRLTAGPRLASIGSILAGQAGGAGGTAFGPFDCADGKPGIKVSGRAGGFVDSMQLVCNVPAAPLRPRDAYLREGTLSILRIMRVTPTPYLQPSQATFFYASLSSAPLGEYRIPVRSSNPAVGSFVNGPEMVDSAAEGRAPVVLGTPGCTVLEIGFPGETPRRAELLVASLANEALALEPSIVEWNSTTTSAFGTLTASSPAPAGGIAVKLSSSHPTVAAVPASATIPAGSRTATFEIRRSGTLGACVILSATGNGVTVQSPVLLRPTTSR